MFTPSPLDKSVPTHPNRYYEQIIASINEAILNGELKEGEKLPSERELAERYQTSRVPVREALKVLEFHGVISPLPGGGLGVKNVSVSDLLQKLRFPYLASNDTLRDLFEVQFLLESYSAQQAAIKRTDEDLERMEASNQALEEDIAQGLSPYEDAQKFHAAVAKATGNQILEDIYQFLYALLDRSRERTMKDRAQELNSLSFHRRICEQIRQRDSDGAKHLMEEHLQFELDKLGRKQESTW